jgi:hypothetical protein
LSVAVFVRAHVGAWGACVATCHSRYRRGKKGGCLHWLVQLAQAPMRENGRVHWAVEYNIMCAVWPSGDAVTVAPWATAAEMGGVHASAHALHDVCVRARVARGRTL